jgi:hypothetical protein
MSIRGREEDLDTKILYVLSWFNDLYTSPSSGRIIFGVIDNVDYIREYMIFVESVEKEENVDFSHITADEHHRVWERVLTNAQLGTFKRMGDPLVKNYDRRPFYIATENRKEDDIKEDLIRVLENTFKNYTGDNDSLSYYTVFYVASYIGKDEEIDPDIIYSFVDREEHKEIPPPLRQRNKTTTTTTEGTDQQTSPIVFTLNGLQSKFSWFENTEKESYMLFTLLDIINTKFKVGDNDDTKTEVKTLWSYVIYSREGNDIVIEQTDRSPTKPTTFVCPIDLGKYAPSFKVTTTTKVTKFFASGVISILLYNDDTSSCSITFEMGALTNALKPIDFSIDDVEKYNDQFDKGFIIVRAFNHPWSNGKLIFSDIDYFDVNDTVNVQYLRSLCWNTLSQTGHVITNPHMIRYLVNPTEFNNKKSIFARRMKTILVNETKRLEGTNHRDVFGMFAHPVTVQNVDNGATTDIKRYLKSSGIFQYNEEILLIKSINTTVNQPIAVLSRKNTNDLRSIYEIKLLCVKIDDEKDSIVSIRTKTNYAYVQLGDVQLLQDVTINDFGLVLLLTQEVDGSGNKGESDGADNSVFYFQFKVTPTGGDGVPFFYTHGLYVFNLGGVGKKREELEDISSKIDDQRLKRSEPLLYIFRRVFNRGYYCLYGKRWTPNGGSKTRIFDYIFYKYYKNDKMGRLVFISVNPNETNWVVREMRIDQSQHLRLRTVYPVVDDKNVIRILVRYADTTKMYKLPNDDEGIDINTFDFASKLKL